MTDRDIVQNTISRLGQRQDDRAPAELAAHFVDVDERTPADQLRFLAKVAELVNYYRDDIVTPAGTWTAFFPALPADPSDSERAAAALMRDYGGTTPAHLALLFAFLELYELPREAINRFTRRHLEFFYERVLRFENRPAVPDRAHVLIELKKLAAPLAIRPEHLFSAGKDATGVELLYTPTRETVVGTSTVESLRSVFVDKSGRGTVKFAPIANSSDGTGGALTGEEPKWHAFGHPGLPAAELGFAVAAPVLRMKEGTRTVTLSLTLSGLEGTPGVGAFDKAFEAFVTGEKGWLGPYTPIPAAGGSGVVRFEFQVPASEKAVVDYNRAIHGYAYAADAPVVQLHLKAGAAIGYFDLQKLTVRRVRVTVQVSGVTALTLENDFGALDPKKKFLPFGPEPIAGSRFMIGCEEAFSKKLTKLSVSLPWQGAPVSFATQYANYGVTVDNASFKATLAFRDGGQWEQKDTPVTLFEPRTETGVRILELTPGTVSLTAAATDGGVYALKAAGSLWATRLVSRLMLERPLRRPFTVAPPEARHGFMTLALQRDFLHATYRNKTIQNALSAAKAQTTPTALLEPYTPAVQGITLAYTAQTDDVDLASTTLADFSNPDVQFFHVGCFGQMREHGYQRDQFVFLAEKAVPLVPLYENAGELVIGVRGLKAGDGVTLLFQVAEGSADPDLPHQDVAWFVLCDNYWKPLGGGEVVRDTTNQLLTSGLVQFVIPPEATTENTILPPGPIWLKAAVPDEVDAVCQLVVVAANAVEVQFRDAKNDPRHLATSLAKGTIAKLKAGLPTVKSVTQPFASFGGSAAESDEALSVRAAERLRHKNRCITAWDYERIVLEAFPAVHTVKCIPHARDGAWLAPGNVLLVLVPDLRNRNARDPLRPKVDADTVSNVLAHVRRRCGPQVQVHAKNPRYQTIQLDFAVRFRRGYDFNFYSAQLNRDLIRFLSPWAYEAGRDLTFGGRMYRSVLLDFVEELEYVDFVTDFKMYSYAGAFDDRDRTDARPETPDAILVSAATHLVREAPAA